MSNKGGRPTKYGRKVQQIANDYLQEIQVEKTKMPYVEELALRLNIDDDTVVRWAGKKNEDGSRAFPKFYATYKRLKTLQKMRLKDLGLTGGIKPTMPIFLLKAEHGLVETDRHEHTGKDGKDLVVNVVNYADNPTS